MAELTAHPLDAEIRRILAAADDLRAGGRREGDDLRPLGSKARRTRGVLLRAAYDQFVANGYRATSVQDIHEAAGVSLGTFYQYFHDKAEVIATLVGELIVASAEELFPPLEIDATGVGARRVVASFVENYAATADFQRIWEEVSHIEAVIARFRGDLAAVLSTSMEASIRRAQRSGAVNPDLDPAGTARALGAMVDRYCYLTFVLDGRRDADTIADTIEVLTTLWNRILSP